MVPWIKRVLLLAVLAQSLWVLTLRWGTPLATPHQFRETETAFPVYYMLHGGHLIHYWTPVMGPPYEIPFEFPTFQLVVAGVCYVTGISIDNAGRLVSVLFLLACLYPLARLAKSNDVDPVVAVCLLVASPLYLYWSTAFLIEMCSLFLCLMFLLCAEEGRWMSQLIFGALSAVTKTTTFLPFLTLSLILKRSWHSVLLAMLYMALAFGWNGYCDHIKAQNPLSAVLVSSQPAQRKHDWGTLEQRLSIEPWSTLWREIQDTL